MANFNAAKAICYGYSYYIQLAFKLELIGEFKAVIPRLHMNITVAVEINRPKSQVWAAITDIENCMNMISAIVDLKVLHKPEQGFVGFKWLETREMFGKESSETMWITDCVDGEYYCTRAENCGAVYVTKMAVTEVDNKTLLTMSFTDSADSIFIRMASSIMGLFFKRTMARMLQKDLDEIKAFVEKN